MVNCCVPLCKSYKGRLQSKDISFHEIPSTNIIRERWLSAISRQGPVKGSKWTPTDYSCVCSLHFRNEDYKETAKKRILKPGAVPSIFPNYPSYLMPKKNKSRTERVTSGSVNAISVTNILQTTILQNEAQEEDTKSNREIGIQVNVPTESSSVQHKREINRLRCQIFRLQKKMVDTENELETLQKKFEENPELNKIYAIKEAAAGKNQKAIYLLDQINNFGKSKPEWSELTLRYCVVWRVVSPKGYEHARSSKFIAAPSRSTLDRYTGSVECDVGVSPLVKMRLKVECENLQSTEKVVSIIADEMSIKERLQYDRTSDKFYGVVNAKGIYDEHIGKYPTLANKLLCFVVNGLSKKFTIPAAYFLVRSLQGSELYKLFQQVIKAVEECGFHVLRIVTDNHRTNVSMFRHFGNGDLKCNVPHPCDSERPLFLSFDYCHIIKNIRSQFLDRDMSDGDGIITAKYLKEIFKLQKDLTLKPIRYLTRKHIEPSTFEKMNVLCAVQVFSPAVTATIEFMMNNSSRFVTSIDFSSAASTVKFMKAMYRFFTIHDVSDKTQHVKQNNPDCMHFYSAADERLQWLQQDFVHYIEKIQSGSKRANLKGFTNETAEALVFTVNSTIQCTVHLLRSGFFYVLTRRFSGDPVEALFSAVRMGGGSNDMTDARTAAFAIRRIVKSGLMIASTAANIIGNEEYCGPVLAGGANVATINESDDTVIPDDVSILLNKLTCHDENVHINLQTVSQALVCGYLVRVVEEKVKCDVCVSNISVPKASTVLMEVITNQDRGGLRYPKPGFVALIKHLQEFVEAAVPYCRKSSKLVKTVKSLAINSLSECDLIKCEKDNNHQQTVSDIIITKFVRPLLTNIGMKQTQKIIRPVCHSKPSSRKILKL